MSASLHVDMQNTALFVPSIVTGAPVNSGAVFGLSGNTVGQWVDLSNSDTYCNIYVTAGPTSGPIAIAIQCAPGPYDIPLAGNDALRRGRPAGDLQQRRRTSHAPDRRRPAQLDVRRLRCRRRARGADVYADRNREA